MKTVFLVFGINLVCSGVFSQTLCKGILLDSATKQPIEFANIGIVGKGIGTVTNEKGEYSFDVPDSVIKEQVKISIIGYKPKAFVAGDFTKITKVHLAQSATVLQEIPISAKKLKIKIAGNETTTKNVSGGFTNNSLGAEIGVKLSIKHLKTHIRKVKININRNSLNTSPVFRFNVYQPDKKGFPGENILTQNIIITPVEKTGYIEFDLTPYAIFVDDDVFISLEWIKDLGDVKGLYFSTKLVGSATYFRHTSQAKWKKTSPVGVGLHAEIAY